MKTVIADTATEATMSGQAADRATTGTNREPSSAAPSTAADPSRATSSIDEMRGEIDEIDAELVRLIQRRTEISQEIGATRASEGGTRIVYSREMKVLERFAALGPAGTDLGMLLLSLGRGKLGRR